MSKALDFLKKAGVFYLATVEGDEPRVRPFGFITEYEGKLTFVTGNQKKVFAQLKANPRVQISATAESGEWIRLTGKAVFNSTREAKTAILEEAPVLKKIYSVDDGIFEVFYITDGEAVFTGKDKSVYTEKVK